MSRTRPSPSSRKTKTPKDTRRWKSILAGPLEKRLLAYTVAGAGAVALGPAASAEIVFTPADVTLSRSGTLQIDVNNDGIPDFVLSKSVTGCSSSFCVAQLQVGGSKDAGVVGRKIYPWASAWPAQPGSLVGPSARWVKVRFQWALMAWDACTPGSCWGGGPWNNVGNKFLGVRFKIDGNVHYGWARFAVTFPPLSAHLTGYAYETEPNKTILAGDRGFGVEASLDSRDAEVEDASLVATPALQPLGLLSLGSLGLDVWRLPRRAGHSHEPAE